MTVSELMAGYTPDEKFKGVGTADQWVVAVGIGETSSEKDYTVIEGGVTNVDINFNPTTSDKQYIRKGNVTTKTGTQFTAAITGDTLHGDAFQDHCMSAGITFGIGEEVTVPFVAFSLNTGKGYKGTAALIVNQWGGGAAGENSPFSVDLKSNGSRPTAYTYSAI